jgi:protein tyrosine phosphatase (PTP) superfamily phosphohydrolase (DUF442 family)
MGEMHLFQEKVATMDVLVLGLCRTGTLCNALFTFYRSRYFRNK